MPPMGKRANGEGLLRQRPNGSWECRITYEDPDTGQRQRLSFYAPTAKAARAKAKKAQERIDAGAPVRDPTRTVAEWLAQWRQTTLAVADCKDSTRSLYATLSRKHLEPAPFGAIQLGRLRPSDIEALILAMRSHMKPPRDEGGEPRRAFSDSTIRTIYTVLRASLDGAVRDGLLARNPAARIQRPGVERREALYLSVADVSALLKAAQPSRYYPALALIASTGIRRGEALALKWSDVDLVAGLVRIKATIQRIEGKLVVSEPKTARSRRAIPLSPPVVAMLRMHRTTQLAERLAAADQWSDTGLVFTTELGRPCEPRNLLRVMEAAAEKVGLTGVGVHSLRHSVAVALLEGGTHIKAVADLLGHSSVAITGDTYGHSTDIAVRAGVDDLAGTLGL
jgi:integrase